MSHQRYKPPVHTLTARYKLLPNYTGLFSPRLAVSSRPCSIWPNPLGYFSRYKNSHGIVELLCQFRILVFRRFQGIGFQKLKHTLKTFTSVPLDAFTGLTLIERGFDCLFQVDLGFGVLDEPGLLAFAFPLDRTVG